MLPDFFFCGDKMNLKIRRSAKAALCGSYAKIIPLLILSILISTVFSVANALVNKYFSYVDSRIIVLTAIVTLPVFVGIISPLKLLMQMKHVCLARGIRYCGNVQMRLSDSLKACDLCIRLFAVKTFWFAVFELVPVVSMLLFICQIKSVAVSLKATYTVVIGLIFLAGAGLIFWLVFIQRYSKSMFYLACYKDFTASDAIRESVLRTQKNAADIFLFKLGFLPWMVLCLFVFPIFYVIPYYKQSVTCLFLSR